MAQARAKSGSRRKPAAKRSSAGVGASVWPWLAVLAVVGGGIALYENSAAARRLVAGIRGEKPAPVAAKPVSSADKSAPKSMAAARQLPMPKPVTPPDSSHTAAIIPPAPIGRPDVDAKPADAAKSDEKLAGAYEAKFYLCGSAKQDDCVVSADRFVFHGQKIRLVGIEVPDIKKPACEGERIKASDAELRVRAFLDSGPFDLVSWQGNDSEIEGHKLREVKRNGMSLGEILVKEGLAKRPGSGKGGWC